MEEYDPNCFFELHEFTHQALWLKGAPVWQALLRMDEYLNLWIRHKIEIEIPSGVFLDTPEKITIGKGTRIEPGAYIQGPCIIGKNTIIRHGAYIRGGLICGDNCVVGHAAEIKHSILLNQAHVAHLGYVGDSILGNRVNLGAGVKCANLRLDRKEISIQEKDTRIQTKMKKLGAILGDDCQIGCNAVLNPGTLIGPRALCLPLTNIKGVIPGNQEARISLEKELLASLRK